MSPMWLARMKTDSVEANRDCSVKNLSILLLAVVLGACGFHLRGAARLSPELERTLITGVSPYSSFAISLHQQLQANGIEIVEDQQQATAILNIAQSRTGRRVLSVDDDGKVREFELFTTLSFEVKGQDKQQLLETQTITLTRDFVFDQNDVLGKEAEAELLQEDMEQDIIRLMLYRLQTIKG
jgi:LPS-assembly lipoprotein